VLKSVRHQLNRCAEIAGDDGGGCVAAWRRLINHYPNHYELTRKDLMVKNIKRYLKVRTCFPC
jgi:hypothetical protein